MNGHAEIPVSHGSGRIWHLEAGDLSVSELYFDGGLTLPAHFHEHACLSLLAGGTMRKGFRSHTYDLLSSSLITIPPGETHTDWFGNRGARIVVVELDAEAAERNNVLEPGVKLLEEVIDQRSRRIEGFAARLSQELRAPDDLSELAVNGLVLELFSSFGRHYRSSSDTRAAQPRWMSTVIEYIHDHDDRPIRIEEIAAEVDLHPGYLARAFRRHVGMPIGSYARAVRIDRAAANLAESDDRILDIAMAAGFTDQSHLTRLFKRRFGVTPAQYRATLR